MEEEFELKKKSRMRKQAKRRFAKTSGTLAGQISRTRAARGYSGEKKVGVKVEI